MSLRFLMLAVLAGCAAGASAQGMSEDYVRERTEAKFGKPHGISASLDLFAHVPYFQQTQRSRAFGLEPTTIRYGQDMDGFPVGIFPDVEFSLRFSWHDSIQAGYGFNFTRAFQDELDDDLNFNGVRYPAGTDIDYGSDWHEFRLHYRRDLFRLGLAKNFTFYATAGLEWAVVSIKTGSDDLPVSDGRDRLRFRELLPWWSAGVGAEYAIGSFKFSVDGRGSYAVGYPTFQKRDGETMKQSIVSITAHVAMEYQVNDWFSLILRGKYRYFTAKLYGGFRADRFTWESMGPEIGIGFRF